MRKTHNEIYFCSVIESYTTGREEERIIATVKGIPH
jgi:hypothetical protein